MGTNSGVALANRLAFEALRNADDIPTMYPEMLLADDNDGDVMTGTPHACAIARAFELHGLRPRSVEPQVTGIWSAEKPTTVTLKLPGWDDPCRDEAVVSARLIWSDRSENEAYVPAEVTTLEDGVTVRAVVPGRPLGTQVRYRVELNLLGGKNVSFPENAADASYEAFVGEGVPLYCNDFEAKSPFSHGWSSGVDQDPGWSEDDADDWQWGTPRGTSGSSDPANAHGGSKILGTDLGKGLRDGRYAPGGSNWVQSPGIDLQGYRNVHIQYWRWLTVENRKYDHASILANGTETWSNAELPEDAADNGAHVDRTWQFHDVDVSDAIHGDEDLYVRFALEADTGLEFGGWNIDDFCVVGYPLETCAAKDGCGQEGGGGSGEEGGGSAIAGVEGGASSLPSMNEGSAAESGGCAFGRAPHRREIAWLAAVWGLGIFARARKRSKAPGR